MSTKKPSSTTPTPPGSVRSVSSTSTASGIGYTTNLVKSIQTYASGPARKKQTARIDPVSDRGYETRQPPQSSASPKVRPKRTKTPVMTEGEKAVLASLKEFSKEELDALNEQLTEARVVKLEALKRANMDRAALSVELQAVLRDLTESKVKAKQQSAAANADRAFVQRVLQKHRELVERYKAQKIMIGSTDSEEMRNLEESVEELRFQLAQAKDLGRTLDELEQCNADTEKLTKLLHYHKIDLAIVKTGSNAALAKAKAHKDSLFKALVQLETQLVAAKEQRELSLKKHQSLQQEKEKLQAGLEETEAAVLRREISWIKSQLENTKTAHEDLARFGKSARRPSSAGEAPEKDARTLRNQIREIDDDLREMKHKAVKDDRAMGWSLSDDFVYEGTIANQNRARTAGTDGHDSRRFAGINVEDRLETKMRELQLQVSSVEELSKRLGNLEETSGRLAEENETLRIEKQLLEEQLCGIEAELDARERKKIRPVEEMTEKERLEAELEEMEALLDAGESSPSQKKKDVVSLAHASREELLGAVEAANRAKEELQAQLHELQEELSQARHGGGESGTHVNEDELLDAVTARDLAETERALVAEDLKMAQSRAVDLQKNLEVLNDEVSIVRDAAVTAAIADRAVVKKENEMLAQQLEEARMEKEKLLEQIAKMKEGGAAVRTVVVSVHGENSRDDVLTEIPLPKGAPTAENRVRARVIQRTKETGAMDLVVTDTDVIELGRIWGMDFVWLGKFRWIPDKALSAALPLGWKEISDNENMPFYYQVSTGQSTYVHPNDSFYRDIFDKIKKEVEAEQLRQAEVVQMHAETASSMEELLAEKSRLTMAREELKRKELEVEQIKNEAQADRRLQLEQLEDERKKVREQEVKRLAGQIARGLQITTSPEEKETKELVAKLEQERKTMDTANYQNLIEYAQYLGMDEKEDEHLLWIAEMALNAPLPPGWEECVDESDNTYFYNEAEGISTFEHPLDEKFRQYYQHMKAVTASADLDRRTSASQ